MAKGTVTITVGERVIEVPIQDVISLGFAANAIVEECEELFDGRRNLKDPTDRILSEDLAKLVEATRKAWYLGLP